MNASAHLHEYQTEFSKAYIAFAVASIAELLFCLGFIAYEVLVTKQLDLTFTPINISLVSCRLAYTVVLCTRMMMMFQSWEIPWGNLFTLDQIGLCVAEGTYIYYSYKRSGPLLRRAYSPRFCHLLFWTVYATPVIFFLPVIPCILTLADSFFIAGDIADILSMAFNLLAATFVVVFEGILLRAFLYSMRRSAESMAESRPEFKVIAVCGSIACVTFLFGLFLYCLGRLAFPQKSLGYGLCIFLSIVLPSVGVSHMLVMKVWLFCIRRGDGMSGRRSTYVVR